MPQCLFCPEAKLTKEHIWPDWMVTLFKLRTSRAERRGRYTATQTRFERVVRAFPRNTISLKRELVCRECNNHWMSDIESYTKPILASMLTHPNRVRELSAIDICTLTTWIVLRSMVFDVFDREENPLPTYYTDLDRYAFADSPTLSPPLNTHIWIGWFIGRPHRAIFNVSNHLNVSEGYGLHVMSAIIDQIAIKLVTWKGHKRSINHASLRDLGWNNYMLHIWPTTQTRVIEWPPDGAFGDQSVKPFTDFLDDKQA